jgi:hypothetical protein
VCYSGCQWLDLTTPLGKGILAFLSALAEDERTRILARANGAGQPPRKEASNSDLNRTRGRAHGAGGSEPARGGPPLPRWSFHQQKIDARYDSGDTTCKIGQQLLQFDALTQGPYAVALQGHGGDQQ